MVPALTIVWTLPGGLGDRSVPGIAFGKKVTRDICIVGRPLARCKEER